MWEKRTYILKSGKIWLHVLFRRLHSCWCYVLSLQSSNKFSSETIILGTRFFLNPHNKENRVEASLCRLGYILQIDNSSTFYFPKCLSLYINDYKNMRCIYIYIQKQFKIEFLNCIRGFHKRSVVLRDSWWCPFNRIISSGPRTEFGLPGLVFQEVVSAEIWGRWILWSIQPNSPREWYCHFTN